MITQQMKLHTEPGYFGTGWPITQEQLDIAVADASQYVKLGDKFKYKSSKEHYTVIGFVSETTNLRKYKDDLCIVRAKREGANAESTFSLEELFGGYIEYCMEGPSTC